MSIVIVIRLLMASVTFSSAEERSSVRGVIPCLINST